MSRIFKRIIAEIGTEAGIEVIRGYVLERLRKVTTKDLYTGIKTKTHTMGVAENKDRAFAKRWVKMMDRLQIDGKRVKEEDLTAENVLIWLRDDRPDLASLIINMNPEGMEWLKEDVNQIFNFLFPAKAKPKTQQPLFVLKKQEKKG